MEVIRRRLGLDSLFTVDNVGFSGGLAIVWKRELEVNIISHSANHIDITIKHSAKSPTWRFTGIYGSPARHRRKDTWELLKELSTNNSLPWMLMGDFNDILSPEEKLGGAQQPLWLMQGFREAIEFSGLRNFEFKGYQFTWERGRGTPNWVREKLDRILVNDGWLDIFGEACAESLETPLSDHLPLAVWPAYTLRIRRRRKFKFENYWLKEAHCREIVHQSWSYTEGLNLCSRFELCSHAIWKWGKDINRNLQPQIAALKRRMGILRCRTDSKGMWEFSNAQQQFINLLDK